MRRSFLPLLTIALVALVIGDQIGRLRRGPRAVAPAPQPAVAESVTTVPGSAELRREPASPEAEAARTAARDLLAREGPTTYLDSLLATTDSVVRRWPDRSEPLRYVVLPGGPADYRPAMSDYVRHAFTVWAGVGVGLRFMEVLDTANADIVVHWIDRFDYDRAGQTDLVWDQFGRVRRASIALAVRTSAGRILPESALRSVALHEAGHALGLPHSADTGDVMFPSTRVDSLSPRDVATLRLLYELPPGSLRAGAARVPPPPPAGPAGATVALALAAPPPPDFHAADAAVLRGIRRGLYPGAVLVVGRHNRILHARAFGHFTWSRRSARPSTATTLWDLASLTKVVATASTTMRLVDQGRLSLDTPVASVLPRFGGGAKDSVTVRMLLDHTSGLRAWMPLYAVATNRDSAIGRLLAEPLERRPGERAVYSDLNYMILALLLERTTGEPFDSLVGEEVLRPLGLHHTMFTPPRSRWSRIAPSTSLDGAPLVGLPNDRNADLLGGVAGHAGLFSTGRDLARFAQVWLRGGKLPNGQPWVSRATMQRFLAPEPGAGTRLLGWDTPDPAAEQPSSFGSLLSGAAYGHTGWTGTEIWIDPARDLFVVLLTNRSFDPRARNSLQAIRHVRAGVADGVARRFPVRCEAAQVRTC